MKKIMILTVMALFVFANLALASRPQQDSVLVGKYLNQNPISLYQIRMGMDVFLDGENQKNEIEAWMEPDGNIFRVLINGELIIDELDTPVQTLPRPINGDIGHVRVKVVGYDKIGNEICEGFDYAFSPNPGHRFDINLGVKLEAILLQVERQDWIPVENTYMSINGYGRYPYDGGHGGYWVYLDPTLTGQTYAIWHNGQIISSGLIEVSGNPEIPRTEKEVFSMSFNLPGGVEVVDLTRNQYEVTFKGMTVEEGETSLVSGVSEKAKVFSIFRAVDSLDIGLDVWVSGLWQVNVTVFAVDDLGQLIQIDDTMALRVEGNESWRQIHFSLHSKDYQNLILVFTNPVYKNPYDKTFGVLFGGAKG